jgi:hypothetical protein
MSTVTGRDEGETPFWETEALLAVIRGNTAKAREILARFDADELDRLVLYVRQLHDLAARVRDQAIETDRFKGGRR